MVNLPELSRSIDDLYASIKSVWCKALDAEVYFTGEGKRHLFYRGNHSPRPPQEKVYKMHLFPYVPDIIAGAEEAIKGNTIANRVTYYSIFGKFEDQGVKVVIKRRRNGKYYYFSVMGQGKSSRHNKKDRLE